MIVNELMAHLSNRKVIKFQRSYIENYFKFIKERLGFKHMHRYTYDSMYKATSLIVLLSGIIIRLCVDTKEDFQKLSESRYF